MYTIGCDYSASATYLALVKDDKVVNTASLVCADGYPERHLFFIRLKKIFLAWSEYRPHVWIEQPWVSGMNFPRSAIMLMRMATYLELAAMEKSYEPHFVLPLVWRKEVYGDARPSFPKQKAVEFARERLGYDVPVMGTTGRGKTPDHNFAEACCIAYYGQLKESIMSGVGR